VGSGSNDIYVVMYSYKLANNGKNITNPNEKIEKHTNTFCGAGFPSFSNV
jgi:hypothetical protein